MSWITLATSVVGTSHIAAGTECQDSCFVGSVDGNEAIFVAVVADGAGSSRFGAEGSALVCEAFRRAVNEHLEAGLELDDLDAEFGRTFIEYCQQKLLPIAEDRSESIREFASTFVGCIVSDTAAIFYQIGDGGAVYSRAEEPGRYFMALPTLSGEYANVTQFVTDEKAVHNLRFNRVPLRLSRVALFTDGLQNLAVDYTADSYGIPFARFFDPMFAPVSTENSTETLVLRLNEFLSSEPVNTRTDDDKTLVLLAQG